LRDIVLKYEVLLASYRHVCRISFPDIDTDDVTDIMRQVKDEITRATVTSAGFSPSTSYINSMFSTRTQFVFDLPTFFPSYSSAKRDSVLSEKNDRSQTNTSEVRITLSGIIFSSFIATGFALYGTATIYGGILILLRQSKGIRS
jgi:hypothetical protein